MTTRSGDNLFGGQLRSVIAMSCDAMTSLPQAPGFLVTPLTGKDLCDSG